MPKRSLLYGTFWPQKINQILLPIIYIFFFKYFFSSFDQNIKGDLEEKITERELLKLEKEAKFFKLTKLEQEITARILQIQTGLFKICECVVMEKILDCLLYNELIFNQAIFLPYFILSKRMTKSLFQFNWLE